MLRRHVLIPLGYGSAYSHIGREMSCLRKDRHGRQFAGKSPARPKVRVSNLLWCVSQEYLDWGSLASVLRAAVALCYPGRGLSAV